MTIDRGLKPVGLAYPLDRIKDYLLITGTDQDRTLAAFINSAVDKIEEECAVVLGARTYVAKLDDWPGEVGIALSPITSITSVKYYDTANDLQTLSTDSYWYDISSNISRIEFDASPGLFANRKNAIEITFVAGSTSWRAIPDNYVNVLMAIVLDLDNQRKGGEGITKGTKQMLRNLSLKTV